MLLIDRCLYKPYNDTIIKKNIHRKFNRNEWNSIVGMGFHGRTEIVIPFL